MARHATRDELLNAFAALSKKEHENDKSTLSRAADRLANDTSYGGGDDLMHECLHRALEGRRTWPLDIDFVHFMFQSMRSVAGADRKRHSSSRTLTISIGTAAESFANQLQQPSVEDELIAREEMLAAADAVDRARVAFMRDPQARRVLDGMVVGKSPIEMRAEFSMTAREFKTTRLRVSRALAKARSSGRPAGIPERGRAHNDEKSASRMNQSDHAACGKRQTVGEPASPPTPQARPTSRRRAL